MAPSFSLVARQSHTPHTHQILVYEEAYSLDKRQIWYLRYGSSAQIATVGRHIKGIGIQNDDYMYLIPYIKVRTYVLCIQHQSTHHIFNITLWLTLKNVQQFTYQHLQSQITLHSRTSCGTNPFYLGTPEAHATLVQQHRVY